MDNPGPTRWAILYSDSQSVLILSPSTAKRTQCPVDINSMKVSHSLNLVTYVYEGICLHIIFRENAVVVMDIPLETMSGWVLSNMCVS